MARTLYLVRHGQAFPDASNDFQRVLTPIGRREAEELGQRLAGHGVTPGMMLSSTALRCLATAEALCVSLGCEPSAIRALDSLYNAPVDALLKTLTMVGPHVETAILVGHNPAVSELVVYLSDHVFDFLPPGGCACLTLTAPWNRLGRGTARFEWVDTPERPYLLA